MAEGYVRVAPDSTGKYIRNEELPIVQPDGTSLTVEQQVITRATDDGTILDTKGISETGAEGIQRRLNEKLLVTLESLNGVLGGPFVFPEPITVTPGDT